MSTRSDDVPDFYGAEPVPGDDFDPWGTTRCDSCLHGDACIFAAWWMGDRECEFSDGTDVDGVASDAITDGNCCAECRLYEPRPR